MTIQCSDRLDHGGVTYDIEPVNLDCLGDIWATVAKENAALPRKLGIRCSSCWRGYVAYWEIIGGRLYLARFDSLADKGTPLTVQKALETERLPALQFSGELRSEVDELVGTVYEPTHPIEHAWIFEKGVMQSRVLRAVYMPTAEEHRRALRTFIETI